MRRLALLIAGLSLSCSGSSTPKADPPPKPSAEQSTPAADVKDKPVADSPTSPPAETEEAGALASIGKAAPEFERPDLDGKVHKLSDYKGKTVVLEWFNPECPFVNHAHTEGSLAKMAAQETDKGVVWLAINSGGEGKQGYGVDKNKAGLEKFKLTHPVLLDPEGTLGRQYEAVKTPHMYLIDPEGKLVYRGAIDNAPFGEVDGGGEKVNYLAAALEDVRAGRAVETPETSAYGCTVKYAKK